MLNWGREFIRAETDHRRNQIVNIEKAFEPFRKDMIIQAGYFTLSKVPSGYVKEAMSISFAKMEQNEFSQLYTAVFATCWRFVLSRVFENEAQEEEAAILLLTYV